jgi:hypothetical protein
VKSAPVSPPSSAQKFIASVILLAFLAQIFLFFVGLMVPLRRASLLWGKDLETRRGVVWGAGRALKQLAEQFPEDAKIYIVDPQPLVHWHSVYYFYPRVISVSMTGRAYRTDADYAQWDERPSREWLAQTNFTHIISFKDGLRVWEITPEMLGNATAR